MSQSEEVRSSIDIVKFIGDFVKLRKAGANFVGLCPFHHEKTPSFAVHPVKQIFHCFGCGVGGDVFKFVMLLESLSFPEALRRVAEKTGIKLRERGLDPASDALERERAAMVKMHDAAARFFAAQLGSTAEGRMARAYLADRGLGDEAIGRFRIGYAPAEGHALMQHLQNEGFAPELMEKGGLVLAESEGRRRLDRFRRRVMFPIARENGSVVAFGGRALGDEPAKYLNSPETPIYSKSKVLFNLDRAAPAIRQTDEAILVEGYLDAISVAMAGFEGVVASCGTSLTGTQARLLSRYTRRVVVNYDPDLAGAAATERSLDLLIQEGFECRVLALPGGLDPDAFVRRQGAAAYKTLLKAAPVYLDYLADRAAAAHDLGTPEGKRKAADAVLPRIIQLPNALLREEWAARLADRLRLDNRLLREEIKRAAGARREVAPAAMVGAIRALPAEKELLRACLESDKLADEFLPGLAEEQAFEGLAAAKIFRSMLEIRRRGDRLDALALEEFLSDAEKQLVYDCQFARTERLVLADAPPLSREQALATATSLRHRRQELGKNEIQAQIQAAEKAGDTARLAELLRAKSQLNFELGKRGRHP